MNELYRAIGISKQAFYKHKTATDKHKERRCYLLEIIRQLRENHPTMGIRDMYYKLNVEGMGRDRFEEFCKAEGFGVKTHKNYRRTTDSTGVLRFPNLLMGRELSGINQAWVSDITYFDVGGKFYYLTFIIDAFSRRIVGHSASKRLLTEQTTLPALQMAIKTRKGDIPEGMIFHSDGGGQYYDKAFRALTEKHNMSNSMCEFAWENGKAERVNGVIKNNYLIHRQINNYADLNKQVDVRYIYITRISRIVSYNVRHL